MKKLFAILLLSGFAYLAQAQVAPLISVTNNKALDTVANTGAKSLGVMINGPQTQITVVATVTKLTGTVAGTVKLQGSIDNVNFAAADATTFTPTDAAGGQSFSWLLTPSKFIYYRVVYTGAGTMTATIQAKSLARK